MNERPQPVTDAAQRIYQAIGHGMAGNTSEAGKILEPFFENEPSTYALCCSMANMVSIATDAANGNGYMAIARVVDALTGRTVDINSVPPADRFSARFIAAWANGDEDTTEALFKALVGDRTDADMQNVMDGVQAVYWGAVDAMRALMDTL